MEKFQKTCPLCGGTQKYSSNDSFRNAIRKNSVCNPCRAKPKKILPENGVWKRICKCGNEMIYSCRHSYNTGKRTNAVCRKCATKESAQDKSYFQSSEYRNKMSLSLRSARQSDSYGEEFKQKCRENKLKQITKHGTQRTFNIEACKFMDKFNSRFGIELQHGLNGGEIQFIGYSLDGYDKNRNIIFEYDEPKHEIGSVKLKDKIREERLISHLHPSQFWRYNEKTNTLREIIGGKELIQCQHQ